MSLDSDFAELETKISQRRELGPASFEPIYYLIFPPEQILAVKQSVLAWTARLTAAGWRVCEFSIRAAIEEIVKSDPRWQMWQAFDRKNPQNWQYVNEAIANALKTGGALQKRLEAVLIELGGEKNALVFVTDLEALHPYLRIGAIESELQGKFGAVTTVFLYPGTRSGNNSLKFLGFYQEDGNYRSVHIGG